MYLIAGKDAGVFLLYYQLSFQLFLLYPSLFTGVHSIYFLICVFMALLLSDDSSLELCIIDGIGVKDASSLSHLQIPCPL